MSRKIVWAPKATKDLASHIDYISMESPRNAVLASDRIFKRVMSLSSVAAGLPGRVPGTYEAHVPKTSLIICFELPHAGALHILRIIHDARDWPEGTRPEDRKGKPS
jgi:plasmid stabilization system protein ParE